MNIIKRMEKLSRYARRRLFAFHFALFDFSSLDDGTFGGTMLVSTLLTACAVFCDVLYGGGNSHLPAPYELLTVIIGRTVLCTTCRLEKN
jgi:hypothetical protein